MERRRIWEFAWMKFIYLIVIIIAILGLIFALSFRSIGVGSVAIIVDPMTGSISGPIVGPAWYIKAPWQYDVPIYYAMDTLGMWTDPEHPGDYSSIYGISKDGLRVGIDIMVRWSLDPLKIMDLYKTYPLLNWKDTTISSIVREEARHAISQYTAIKVIEEREVISRSMEEAISEVLLAEPSLRGTIINLEIDLRDIEPPADFLKAIEAKLTKEQEMIAAEFEKSRILILANATAMEKIIAAQAEAEVRIIVANATREAVEIISGETGSSNSTQMVELYLTLEALKVIAKETGFFVLVVTPEGVSVPIMIPPTAE